MTFREFSTGILGICFYRNHILQGPLFRGNWFTVFFEALKIQFDRFLRIADSIIDRITERDTSGQCWDGHRVSSLRFFA